MVYATHDEQAGEESKAAEKDEAVATAAGAAGGVVGGTSGGGTSGGGGGKVVLDKNLKAAVAGVLALVKEKAKVSEWCGVGHPCLLVCTYCIIRSRVRVATAANTPATTAHQSPRHALFVHSLI